MKADQPADPLSALIVQSFQFIMMCPESLADGHAEGQQDLQHAV